MHNTNPRKFPLTLLAIFLFFQNALACAATNFWERQSAGLVSGIVSALLVNPVQPTTLYAGTDNMTACPAFAESCVSKELGGMSRSTDGAATWATIGPASRSVLSLASNPLTPTILYAGTRAGVLRSADGGITWSEASAGLPLAPHISALAIDPMLPTTLYAGSNSNGLFKSKDEGATWAPANSGLVNTSIRALLIDPATPSTVYAAGMTNYQPATNGGGVYKSTDGGATWVAVNTGLTHTDVTSLAIDPLTPTTLYAGTFGGGLFKSSNGGASWRAINTGLAATSAGYVSVTALAINPAQPDTLYAGSWSDGVFKSSNGGTTWSALKAGLGPGTIVKSLAIAPTTPTILYAGTLHGVFRFDEGSDPAHPISDSDRIFNYLEAAYPQYLAPANAASATTQMYMYTPPIYYYRHYPDSAAYIATSGGMVYYLGPASGNSILPLGTQADFLAAAMKSGF